MLVDHVKHALIGTIGTIKYFALAIENKLLKIECDSLGDAKVFGVLGDADLHFLAGAKEMINRISAGKDHTRVIGYFNLLFAEIPGRYGLQPDKWLEIQMYIVLPGKLEIRRFVAFGLRLGNQDLIYCFGLNVGLINPIFYHVRFG